MVPVLATVNYIYFRKIANFSITKTLMNNFKYNTKKNVIEIARISKDDTYKPQK
jgi:hypothetical protein